MLFLSYLILYSTSLLSIFLLVRGFLKGKVNAYYFIIPILMIFYVLPEILDFIIGIKFTGPYFTNSMTSALLDSKTTIIYNYYISFIVILFTYLMHKTATIRNNLLESQINNISLKYNKYKYLYWILLVSPIFLVFYTGNTEFYSEYLTRDRANGPQIQATINKLVLTTTLLSTIVITHYIKLIKQKHSWQPYLPIITINILLTINFYLHGKRSIVVAFLMMLIVILFISKAVSRKKLLYLSALFLLSTLLFFKLYSKNIEVGSSLTGIISGLRVDLSRDYVTKFVIYNDLLNDRPILPFKGASLLFLFIFFLPRSIYPDKPMPYAVYFTNSAFGNFGNDYLYGWGLTTSIIAELISNLGWYGLIAFPLFYILVVRSIKNIRSIFTHLLTYFVLILLLLVEPIAIMFVLIILLILVIKRNKKITFRRS